MKKLLVVLLVLITAGSVTANVLLYQRYSSRRPLLRIGSTVITKKQYFDLLEHQHGQPVLNKLVLEEVVGQAARKAGVWPTDKDVDARIAELQRVAPQILGRYNADPSRRQAMRREIASSLALENLRLRGVSVSDAELAAFYRANQRALTPPPQAQTTVVVTTNRVDADTAADLLRRNMALQVIARQPRLNVVGLNGYDPAWSALPPSDIGRLGKRVLGMKPGEVAVIPVLDAFVTVRVRQQSSGALPLSRVRDRVARLARLQKAPEDAVMLARLYRDARVTFEADRYAGYFAELEKLAPASDGKAAGGKRASLR